MSFTKTSVARPSVAGIRKVSLSSDGSPIRLPPLHSETSGSNLQNGLQGNAMAIPPVKLSPELLRPSREDLKVKEPKTPTRVSVPVRSEQSGRLISSAELEKTKRDLKDSLAREKDLKKHVVALNTSVGELNDKIKEKENVLMGLQSQLKKQEEYYKEMYERECCNHQDTIKHWNSTKDQLDAKTQEIHNLHKEHDAKIKEITQTFEQHLQNLQKEKDEEISVRDQKLNKLKTQMADALSGNSWERQQQLDELSKELKRTQEEADSLRLKIKSLHRSASKSGGCNNCDSNVTKLTTALKSNAEKDKYIKELKTVCSKFEKQLSQQDTLLKKISESQGYKVTTFPK